MKNLYQYSAEGHPTKFVWDKFNEAKGQASASEVSKGKDALTTKISKELDELANDIKLSDTLDKDKILAKINEGGSNSEKYVQRTDGTMILKDRVNKEKVKITAGNVLKIKDRNDNEILKVDLNTNEIKRNTNNAFSLEKKEETPETDASKEFKKKIETLDGNIEDMQEEDLVSLEGKIRNLRTEIKDNTELTAKERAHLLGLLNSLTARIVARRNVLKPNNNVEVVSDTMKEYEAKIAGFESRLSGAEGKALEDLKTDAEGLKKEINGVAEEKLSDEEKKTLTARIDSLIKNIEAKQNDLDNIDKKKAVSEKIKKAEDLINKIDITGLSITNCNDIPLGDSITKAKDALDDARTAAEDGEYEDLIGEVDGLEKEFNHKNEQVELYKIGADKQKEVTDEYQKQTDERLNEIDADITAKVKEHTDKLEKLAKTTSNPKELPVEQLTIDQTKEPQSYEQIQKGMQAHRLDSMMMLEEVNFLQDCGQKFAEEIAEFEEEKSAFNMPNIGRFVASGIAILPGMVWDLGEKALGTGKRAGDRFGWLGFGNSRAEELQKKQVQFETDFTVKQGELEGKKTALDDYGEKLQDNSEILKTTAPEEVKTNIKKSIEDQLLGKGLDINDDPWKEIHRKLTEEFEDTAENKVKPAVDQLYMMVDGSVPELADATDTSLNAASQTADYIEDLDIHSATVLDMSVGFLTKNIAKGLDGVGDVLASNPVTGVLGGLCRAAGGLVEGVGTLVTDPDKVAAGLGGLFGYEYGNGFSLSRAGDAWSGLATGFLGVEAFKTGFAKLKKGGFLNVMHGLGEITAGVGEGGGNIIATVFTGGTVAGVRSGGILGKLGTVGSKIARTGVAKVAKYMPESIVNGASGVGRVGTKLGKFAAKGGDLALSPLRLGLRPLRALKAGRALERGLTPARWVKNGNMKYLRNQKARYLKSSRRMERLAKNAKNKSLKESYLKEAKNISDKANKIDISPVVKPKGNISQLQKDVSKAEKALKKSNEATKKVVELEKGLEKAQKAVVEAERNVANAGKRSRLEKLNPKNKNPQKVLDKAKKDLAKIEKDITKNKEFVGDNAVLKQNLEKSNRSLEKSKGRENMNVKNSEKVGDVKKGMATEGKIYKEKIQKLETENIKLEGKVNKIRKELDDMDKARTLNTADKSDYGKLSAEYENTLLKHKQNSAEISMNKDLLKETNIQAAQEITIPKSTAEKVSESSKWYNKKGVRAAAGVAVMTAIPASYTAAEIEKNKITNIKENIPAKAEFERTPLVDLDGSPAPVVAAASGTAPSVTPEQTLPYETADKTLFENVRKNQLESFFKTSSEMDEKNIKSDILKYSVQDVKVVIDGAEGKTLTDLWKVKESGKAVAFTLDSKMGQNKIPSLTKIEIKTT